MAIFDTSVHHSAWPSAAASVALLLPLALLAVYLILARRESRPQSPWSDWRTASFITGIGLLLFALSPPIAAFAHASLRGHMLQHLLLGMFAPLFLVLGAPGTLLLRALPLTSARSLIRLLATRPVRCITHPFSAMLLDMGGMALLYLSPLYAWSQHMPALHVLVHVHFLVAGYLFTWAIAGPDPAPHRPDLRVRLAALFVGTAVHAIVAKLMVAWHFPRGTPYTADDILEAAQWMYYGGDFAEILLAIAFFSIWFRRRRSGAGDAGHGVYAEEFSPPTCRRKLLRKTRMQCQPSRPAFLAAAMPADLRSGRPVRALRPCHAEATAAYAQHQAQRDRAEHHPGHHARAL